MQQHNHTFESIEDLELFIEANIGSSHSLLVQLFCGNLDTTTVQTILNLIKSRLPLANIIGASTTGEITNGVIQDKSIVISFTLFDSTDIRMHYYKSVSFKEGEETANTFVKKNTKALIGFSEALKSDSELFLEGFSSINHRVPIAGGNAGDNLAFKKTFVILDTTIYFEGIVMCALDSDVLNVHTNYSLEWNRIGKEMTVTKAENNIIYEIDYTPVEELYKHYLGTQIVGSFPESIIEFPLVKIENDVAIARSVIAKSGEGYLYAGHFKNGDKVKFAIGNIEEIIEGGKKIYNSISAYPAEVIFVYSCSVRKNFFQEELKHELSYIEKAAPTSGFFTYGEFYHSKVKNQILNITTTILALWESQKKKKSIEVLDVESKKSNRLSSLINLVNVSDSILNQYKQILDYSSIVSKTDTKGIITYVNDEFCKISGYTKGELIGLKHNVVKHPDTDKLVFTDMWKTIKSKKVWYGTIKNLSKSGFTYSVKTVIMPILDDNGEIIEYIAARTDVTDLILKDQIIEYQYKDELTSVQNRTALHKKLSYKSSKNATLILVNIDRFSDINNYFGYQAGDEVLKYFAKELNKKYKNVYRISGDEFAILNNSELPIKDIKNMIYELENQEYEFSNNRFPLFVSCGIAYAKKKDIYKFAHIALKNNQKSEELLCSYNRGDLSDKIENNIKVISEIKLAINNDTFIPFYQAIVDNNTKKIVKYESLIRMKNSDDKIISPIFFLEHAKKAKLYTKLTEIMIEKTFTKFSAQEYEFSINLALQDIESINVKKTLMENLQKHQCGERVVLEIVESEGIENFDEVYSFIAEVRKYGCKIAVDDFGTGYSNFSYLTKLSVDFIKIDGSLVKGLEKDRAKQVTIESILHFAKNMGIQTIAEFVEDEATYEILTQLGVDYSQGYYFSIPDAQLL